MAATQWCFVTNELLHDQLFAGQPALMAFSPHELAGALVSVLWAPYNAVAFASRQKCLAHLLRDLELVKRYKSPGAHRPVFARKLRRLTKDAIRLLPQVPVSTGRSRCRNSLGTCCRFFRGRNGSNRTDRSARPFRAAWLGSGGEAYTPPGTSRWGRSRQRPRVKSGTSVTAARPATLRSLSGPMTLHAAAS